MIRIIARCVVGACLAAMCITSVHIPFAHQVERQKQVARHHHENDPDQVVLLSDPTGAFDSDGAVEEEVVVRVYNAHSVVGLLDAATENLEGVDRGTVIGVARLPAGLFVLACLVACLASFWRSVVSFLIYLAVLAATLLAIGRSVIWILEDSERTEFAMFSSTGTFSVLLYQYDAAFALAAGILLASLTLRSFHSSRPVFALHLLLTKVYALSYAFSIWVIWAAFTVRRRPPGLEPTTGMFLGMAGCAVALVVATILVFIRPRRFP